MPSNRPTSPMAVGISIDNARDNLERAQDLYERGYGYAHDSKDRPTDDQNKRVSGSGRSDPVPGIAVNQQVPRRILGRVAAKLQHIEKDSRAVLHMLDDVFKEPFNCPTCGLTYNPKCKDGSDHEEDFLPLSAYRNPDQDSTVALKESQTTMRKRAIERELQRIQIREETLRGELTRLG